MKNHRNSISMNPMAYLGTIFRENKKYHHGPIHPTNIDDFPTNIPFNHHHIDDFPTNIPFNHHHIL